MRWKFKFVSWLLFCYFINLPRRIRNLLNHILKYKHSFKSHIWIIELVFFIIDLTLLPEILQIIFELINWHLRPLSEKERQTLKPVFGDSIAYNYVRINDRSFVAKKMNIAFVSFNIIHYNHYLFPAILVHEMVHIWQYHRFGSVYIIRSLIAQRSEDGYHYGGPMQLYLDSKKGLNLMDYNYEQMGDIIRDAYLMNVSSGYPNIKQLYNRYLDFIQNN